VATYDRFKRWSIQVADPMVDDAGPETELSDAIAESLFLEIALEVFCGEQATAFVSELRPVRGRACEYSVQWLSGRLVGPRLRHRRRNEKAPPTSPVGPD
jgi:hypothetical protein